MPRGHTDFLPSSSGLKFANSFPAGVPVLTLAFALVGTGHGGGVYRRHLFARGSGSHFGQSIGKGAHYHCRS